ncbi:MAG: hypothetical protein HY973_00285 [Candidatus Kerfeldbacteria bacterium]|nr:hypothetical protein [Candidatus Kerfeldbacteria bacterium]
MTIKPKKSLASFFAKVLCLISAIVLLVIISTKVSQARKILEPYQAKSGNVLTVTKWNNLLNDLGHSLDSGNGDEDALFIDNSGNVGIGTTTPSALLNLRGNLYSALTGTVAVTNFSTAVIGTGTSFSTELVVGDSIKIGAEIFTVSAINSDLDLTLDSAYQGVTASGLTAYRDPILFAIDNGDGVNKLTITKSGNVGIGQTVPAAKLDILNSSTTNGLALLGNTTLQQASGNEVAYTLNYTTNKTAGNDTGLLINMTDTASPGTSRLLDLSAGGTNKFNVSQGGNLELAGGIYTTTIGNTLIIQSGWGDWNTSDTSLLLGSNTYTQILGTGIPVKIAPTYNQTSGTAANTDLLINRTQTAVGSGLQLLQDWQVNGVSKMVINNQGNVGIGTITPQTNLEVFTSAINTGLYLTNTNVIHGITGQAPTNVFGSFVVDTAGAGGLKITGFSDIAGQEPIKIKGFFGNTNPTDTVPAILFTAGRRSVTGVTALANSKTAFQFENNNSGTKLLTILGSGNVGIGVAIPKTKLHVSGQIYQDSAGTKMIFKSPDASCSACGPNNLDAWTCVSMATCP